MPSPVYRKRNRHFWLIATLGAITTSSGCAATPEAAPIGEQQAPLQIADATGAQTPPPPASPARAEPVNAMTMAVVGAGALSCAARVQQVSSFLGFGPDAGGHLMPLSSQPDQRLFALQMELPAGAMGNSFVDMNFAPNQANGCGATYSAVSYWPQSCDAVASRQFEGLRRSAAILTDVLVLDGGPLMKVFLMKAGNSGCVSIKKEILG